MAELVYSPVVFTCKAMFRILDLKLDVRGSEHIPVDRAAGRDSDDEAVRRLRAGEVVGVFPEATISCSFTVKDLKSGAARMAADAGVPLIPMAVWGPQQLRIADAGPARHRARAIPGHAAG